MNLRASLVVFVALVVSCGGSALEKRSVDGKGGEPSSGGRASTGKGGMSGATDAAGAAGAVDAAGAGGAADTAGAGGVEDVAGAAGAAGSAGAPDCADTPGDCQQTICDGSGESFVVVDPSDLPGAESACVTPVCTNDGPLMVASPPQSDCQGAFGQGLCDGLGECVECLEDADCAPGMVCGQHACVSEGDCDDAAQNGNETDVDCGGSSCGPCDDGQACLIDQDCAADLCDPLWLICLPFTCRDGVQNDDETDVDCGGLTCAGCYIGEGCLVNSDCSTNKCNPDTGACYGNACGDQRQDGTETDVDCGGLTCGPCAVGKMCHSNFDCQSGFCVHSWKPDRCG